MRQVLFNGSSRFNKINGVVIVLFNTGSDRENIGVKNNIFRRETNHFGQHFIRACTDFDLTFIGICLTIFIKCHYDDCGTILTNQPGVFDKVFFAFFKRDRIYDRFALHALQTGFDNVPFGRIDHHRYT